MLWIILLIFNALKGFASVSCGNFFCDLKTIFEQQQRKLINMAIIFSYHSSCHDLPVVLVDFCVGGFLRRLHHICRGDFVLSNYINFHRGGAEDLLHLC